MPASIPLDVYILPIMLQSSPNRKFLTYPSPSPHGGGRNRFVTMETNARRLKNHVAASFYGNVFPDERLFRRVCSERKDDRDRAVRREKH